MNRETVAKFIETIAATLRRYLPSLPKKFGYSVVIKLEIAILILTSLYLYLFRIHPYFVLTSQSIREQQAANREIATTLLRRYSEQVRELDLWWHARVASENDVPKLLAALNPAGTSLIGAIKVGEIVAKPDYRTVSIAAEFQGDYKTLLEWFRHIEGLPFFLEVDSLSLAPHPNEALLKEGVEIPPLFGQIKLRAILKK